MTFVDISNQKEVNNGFSYKNIKIQATSVSFDV